MPPWGTGTLPPARSSRSSGTHTGPSSSVLGTRGTEGRADHGTQASREVGGAPGGDLYPRKNSSHIQSEDPGVTPGRYFPYS